MRKLRQVFESAVTTDPKAWKPEKWVVYHQKNPKAGFEPKKYRNKTSFNKKRWL